MTSATQCFRSEAGSAGKDTTGIFRVHQFDKIEMFSFCNPDESWNELEMLREIEQEILNELGLPHRVILVASGDLGAPAALKYDCEVWLPSSSQRTHFIVIRASKLLDNEIAKRWNRLLC